ncbi:MAG: aminotransferase class I/II-fold pyridoxal phosphate-dependent enzyme, partial [Actinomycetia bacterium]|nr:aminotransferase class I/II-fold pyridoxal phosphate-dependent enzyme [Actinomycetes bacterium]
LANEDYFEKVISEILAERERVFNAVQALPGLEAYPSFANFILIKSERSGPELWRKLLSKSILVRDFDGAAGLENCLRVTIGSPEQNSALIDVLANGG